MNESKDLIIPASIRNFKQTHKNRNTFNSSSGCIALEPQATAQLTSILSPMETLIFTS